MKTRSQLLESALEAAKKMVVYLETTYGAAPRDIVISFDEALAALDAAKEELDTVTLPRDFINHIYNVGYHSGHHDTVEARFVDVHYTEMSSYHADMVDELIAYQLKSALDGAQPEGGK